MDVIQYVTIMTNLILFYIETEYDISSFTFFSLSNVSEEKAHLNRSPFFKQSSAVFGRSLY